MPDVNIEEFLQQLDSNLTDEDVTSWLSEDACDPGYQVLSDDITQVSDHQSDDNSTDEEEDEAHLPDIPSSGKVADKCVSWYEQQEECTAISNVAKEN